MTVDELYDLIGELSCDNGGKEVKIVSDKDSGSYLCISEGNGKVKIIASL